MIRVSVCIATYNGADFIIDQLKSILCQLGLNDEVVISDDSSTDDTVVLIKSLNDGRIRVFEGQKFRSPIYNFENAISKAEGTYIFLADQDDIWLDGRVDKCLLFLEDNYDLVLNNCKIVDKDLHVVNESFFGLNNSRKGLLNNLMKNSYLGCCLAFRKDILPLILPFPKPIPMHDIWIGWVAELTLRIKFVDECLVLYRRHGKNESSSSEKSPFGIFRKMKFRWDVLKYVPLILVRRFKYR